MQPRSTPFARTAPAPWTLQGRGYITLLRYPAGADAQDRFLPGSLQGRRAASRLAWMMFVDYQQSEVGPYHELLFIPGRFPFEDGRRHLSISRILVSSMDSVVNGRRNWGIPKELAQFEVDYGAGRVDAVRVLQDGRLLAQLQYRHFPLSLPFSTALVPSGMRTLGQHHEGQTYIYTPSAHGWIKPARLIAATSDPERFPDLTQAHAVLSVQASRFQMRFPVSRVLPRPQEPSA